MNRKSIIKRIVIACAIIALALSFFIRPIMQYLFMPAMFFVMSNTFDQMKMRLLCKTDHQALLDACREVLEQGNLDIGRNYLVSEVPNLPKPILNLTSSVIYIEDVNGPIMLKMGGTLNHFGVYAYPEDYKAPWKNWKYGNRELVPGLWYYDDEYDSPYYRKKIEDWLQKKK